MIIWLLIVFLAGLVTALSPCVLPVLPAALSSMGKGKWRPLGLVIGLVIGFSVFTLFLIALMQHFGFSANFLRTFAILIIGFFGLALILPYLSDRFATSTAHILNWGSQMSEGFISSLSFGAVLGLIWTPFASPILLVIAALMQQTTADILFLTLAYSLGASLPLLAFAYGSSRLLTAMPLFAKYTRVIGQVFGWLLLLTAIALTFDLDVAFQQRILDDLPNTQIDNNSKLKQELNKLRPAPTGFPSN